MKIVSIAISMEKGVCKELVERANLIEEHGIEGDAHAGRWHRQISLLASEQIDKAKAKGFDVTFGDFAENIATVGVDWKSIPVGTKFRLGKTALLQITQIGKKCHKGCEVFKRTGDCIMPREGVFARVLQSGEILCGDDIRWEN